MLPPVSHLNQERNMHTLSTVYKPEQSKTNLNKLWVDFLACKRCLICAYFSPDSDHTTFSMEKALLLIKDSYFSQKQQFEVKNVLMLDLFQLLSSPDVNWWTGVVWITCVLLWCFYQLFGLSFWRHPFTAEHPLLRQWLRLHGHQ